MTLMYTFSRRAGLVRRIMRVEGLRGAPPLSGAAVPLPTRRCSLHGAAANPVLPPSRRCHLRGTAGRGRAINRYVTFLYWGF